MRMLKIILKLAPFVIGLAHISNELETKKKKKFSVGRSLILLMALSALILVSTMINVRLHYNDAFTGKIDGCAVIFGAAVWKGDQPSNALNDRTQAAIDLYQNASVNCLVFSGGESKYGAHEVAVMERLALEAGVPESVMEYDYDGNNTLATILNLPKERAYVLVSNDFHMARIGLMAKRTGIEEFYLHAAPYEYGRYTKNLNYYWREVAGTLVVWFGL